MPLFCMHWKLHSHNKSETMTYFASLTAEDHEKDIGPKVKVYGRWHNLSNASGTIIAEAPTIDDIQKWCYNWSEQTCDIVVTPVMDHNKVREMILGAPPSWVYYYDRTNDEPKEGESLYLARYKFRDTESLIKGYEIGCSMTWDEDMEANGKAGLQHLGRWHIPSEGRGIFLCVTKDHNDLFVWANKWKEMGDIEFEPVLTDKAVAKIIKEKPGYDEKLSKLMEKLGMA